MKKRMVALVLFCTLLAMLCSACAREDADYFDTFRTAFHADVQGELNGTCFSALIEAGAQPTEGQRQITLTFYAPEGLKGTVLHRSEAGELSLSVGDVQVESAVTDAFSPLFELFPVEGEVSEAVLTDGGYTQVSGADFTVTFFADGTPCEIEKGGVTAKVISFAPVLE